VEAIENYLLLVQAALQVRLAAPVAVLTEQDARPEQADQDHQKGRPRSRRCASHRSLPSSRSARLTTAVCRTIRPPFTSSVVAIETGGPSG
jgi:hypothetical protein